MAFSFVQSGTGSGSSVANLASSSITTTAGNTLVIAIYNNATAGNQTLTDGAIGNTYNYIGNVGSGVNFLALYYAKNINGGATSITVPGNSNGIWVGEYSGLSTTAPFISGSFAGQQINGPNTVGSDTLSSTNGNFSVQPALLFGCAVNCNALNGTDAGPSVGTSLAYTGRTTGWLGTSSQQVAACEDFRVTATGNYAATFGTVSGNKFDTFNMVVAGFAEPGAGGAAGVPYMNYGLQPMLAT